VTKASGTKAFRSLAAFALIVLGLPRCAGAAGPDVILSDIPLVVDYTRSNTITAISMTTVSCNVGDASLNWFAQPSNAHPVIAQNMYRLKDGRMEQIGQAWVKHGFAALNERACFADCPFNQPFVRLSVHCSDPYVESLNRGPDLGARSEINPVTGYFDGVTANQHEGHLHTGISHSLQVLHADLGNADARYFVEGHYVTADDALAGNGNNNASHREVRVTGTLNNWTLTPLGATVREQPAIRAWPDATFVELDSWPEDGRIIVAYKVTESGGGEFRYDYAIYNMNSDRGVRSFSVPARFTKQLFGFHAVRSHDEAFTNIVWPVTQEPNGHVTWATSPYTPTDNSNPIRWGTLYNFWIDTTEPPVPAVAALERYKPGAGPDLIWARVLAPAAGDCNGNGTADDTDIDSGESEDLDEDGIPDECVSCTMSDGCGLSDRCTVRACDDGWCLEEELLYGDADGDGRLLMRDVTCVLDAFALRSACPEPDLFPCEMDYEVTMDDVLAALEAFARRDPCCE